MAAQEMRAAKLPRPPAARTGALRLTVELAAKRPALVIAAMPSDTLTRLRARIDAACGMPPEMQRVRAGGKQLEEGPQTLEQRGIGPQTALSVITREAEVEQLLAEESSCRLAEAAAAARVAEAEAALAGIAVGKRWITEPMRLRLYRENGSVKHWRWFKLIRESRIDRVGCEYFVSWGKEEDGREHMLWKKCGLAPPKTVKLTAVRHTEQPRRFWPGGFVIDADNRPLLVASPDARTQEAWNTALRAVVAALAALTAYQKVHAALRIAEAKTREAQAALRAIQALSDSDEQQIAAKEAKLLVEVLEPLYVELEQQLLGSQDCVAALRAARNLRDTETSLQVAEHLSNHYWSTTPNAVHDALIKAVRKAQQQLNESASESQSTAELDAMEERCRELELLAAQQQAELTRLGAAAEKEQAGIARLHKTVRRGEDETAAAARALLARAQQDMERLLDEYDAVAVARRRTIAEHAATLFLALPS